jgi:hypothetical protein
MGNIYLKEDWFTSRQYDVSLQIAVPNGTRVAAAIFGGNNHGKT